MTEQTVDGDAWVLVGTMDEPNDLMILNNDGNIMTFSSKEAAEAFKAENDVPDNMRAAQVHEVGTKNAKSINKRMN